MNKLKLLILDVDGVLTDGKKYYGKDGMPQLKTFCDKDWTAIKIFKAIGVDVVFLTGDPFNEEIGKNRNIHTIVNRKNGVHRDKSHYLDDLCNQYNCSREEVVYVGDDFFDIGLMKLLKFSFCPMDAPRIVRQHCIPLSTKGGDNLLYDLYTMCEYTGLIEVFEYDEIVNKVYDLDIKESF